MGGALQANGGGSIAGEWAGASQFRGGIVGEWREFVAGGMIVPCLMHSTLQVCKFPKLPVILISFHTCPPLSRQACSPLLPTCPSPSSPEHSRCSSASPSSWGSARESGGGGGEEGSHA